MMKELIKNNKKYIKETLLLLLGGIIINLACFLMGTIYSHAETLEDNQFPYYMDKIYSFSDRWGSYDNINQLWQELNETDYIVNQTISHFSDIGVTSSDVLMFRFYEVSDNSSSGYLTYRFRVYINPEIRDDYSQTALFSQTQVKVYARYKDIYFKYYLSSHNLEFYTMSSDSSSVQNQWLGGLPSVFSSEYGDQQLNYPVYLYNANSLNSANGSIIFAYSKISVGDFTDLPGLDEILNNIQNTWEPPSNITGHALPSQPTENPNNNDFQNRLQMFEYLKDCINAIVGNLGYNIKNWFDNLIGKMVEGFNSVSQNIYNGFKTLMDNIKDFFGAKIDAIIDKFNYITEPLNSQELAENLNNANFSSDFLGLTTTISTFGTAFTSGSEPSSCSFTLDFSNSYYNFGVCEFSLDWILPFRSGIRLIVGCLCVYSLVVSIFTSLNTYIGGTSSINDDI